MMDMQFVMDGVKAGGKGGAEGEVDNTPVDVMAEKLDNMLLLIYHYLKEVSPTPFIVFCYVIHTFLENARM